MEGPKYHRTRPQASARAFVVAVASVSRSRGTARPAGYRGYATRELRTGGLARGSSRQDDDRGVPELLAGPCHRRSGEPGTQPSLTPIPAS